MPLNSNELQRVRLLLKQAQDKLYEAYEITYDGKEVTLAASANACIKNIDRDITKVGQLLAGRTR